VEWSSLRNRVKGILEIPPVLIRASGRYGGDFVGVLRKLTAALQRRYLPNEAFHEGLLDPRSPADVFDRNVSRSVLVRIQKRSNPESWDSLLSDKTIFYKFCSVADIPTPKVLGYFFKSSPGWSHTGRLLPGRDEWESFFEKECAPEFVIKPNRGFYGSGIQIYAREGSSFVDPAGVRFTAASLYDAMKQDRRYSAFVVQERFRNHPELMKLSGTEGLQTVRIITRIGRGGECRILYTYLKTIVGNNLTDNFVHGTSGNLMVEASLGDGKLTEVVGTGSPKIPSHPSSGIPFRGFRLPLWEEACQLARDSAQKFAPVGTIGWDVAIGESRPVIIEGNIWYDPPSPPDMKRFIADVSPL
jgi:hypothetical protein